MKNTLKALTLVAAMTLPLAAFAADTTDTKDSKETTSAPPQGAMVYPCWDMMKDGHMMHMRGMMNGKIQTPPQGVKAHACWDVMNDGHMMHMHNMGITWNGAQNPPAKQ